MMAEESRQSMLSSQERTRARQAAILTRLERAVQGQPQQSQWALPRVIWRAGAMQLPAAVPSLLALAAKETDMAKYCVAWALGRCANQDTAPEVAAVLAQYYQNSANSGAVRRIAAEGLSRLHKNNPQSAFFRTLIDKLPSSLREAVEKGDPDGLTRKLRELLFELQTTSNNFLTTLYHLTQPQPQIRASLLTILAELPLQPNYFKQFRRILKAAEFREDAEMYGLLAYRLEKVAAFYNRRRWRYSDIPKIGRINVEEEYRKKQPRIAYSDKTREYLRRRVIHALQHAGECEQRAYTDLATAILLRFDDAADRTAPSKVTAYRYEYRPWRRIELVTHYDAYAACKLLYFLLYAHSPRYALKKGGTAWHCVAPYQPGQPAPDVREEAFPELWTQAPQHLLTLLLQSRCQPVHEFATKAFRAVPDYASYVNLAQVIAMLGLPYTPTNVLALEIAQQRYSPAAPDQELVRALLFCAYQPARATAQAWIAAQPAFFFQEADFVCNVMLSPHADVLAWARELLPTCSFTELQEKTIITRVLAALLTRKAEDLPAELVQGIGEILLAAFAQTLSRLGVDVIRDLLQHPNANMQALGGKILLHHATDPTRLPDDLLLALLQATSPQVRAIGVQVLGNFPDYVLLAKEQLLTSFCISAFAEIRQAVKPIIGRLAAVNASFGQKLAQLLYSVLLFKEAYEGVHQDVYRLFTAELAGGLGQFDPPKAWKLLNSSHLQANLFGCYLLRTTLAVQRFTMPQIVALSKNELRELRETAWNFYRQHPDRIKQDKTDALGILDADWEDTRAFAFDYFRTAFQAEDWTPELLVSLCDSVRPDVQAFGRDLITRFFEEADGTEYLLKLSQHPAAELQLLATSYLERFAADRIEQLERLEPFFITLLMQVNKGRKAKDRILQFLRAEALKAEAAAQVAARILTRQSLTLAIGDKAACIAILRDIRTQYPQIETPLAVKEPAVSARQ